MNKKGFTIVELLVGIIIFVIGIISAYLLIYSAISSSTKSRDEIVIANIAREKMELVRNVRDTNWIKFLDWNKLNSAGLPGEYLEEGLYKIENNFSGTQNKIKIFKLSSSFSEDNIFEQTLQSDNVQLCINNNGIYTYECIGAEKTKYYSYLKIENLKTEDVNGNTINVQDAIKITSINVVRSKSNPIYKISSIITNWKK